MFLISFVTLQKYISCFFLVQIASDPKTDYDSKADFPFYIFIVELIIKFIDANTIRSVFHLGHPNSAYMFQDFIISYILSIIKRSCAI